MEGIFEATAPGDFLDRQTRVQEQVGGDSQPAMVKLTHRSGDVSLPADLEEVLFAQARRLGQVCKAQGLLVGALNQGAHPINPSVNRARVLPASPEQKCSQQIQREVAKMLRRQRIVCRKSTAALVSAVEQLLEMRPPERWADGPRHERTQNLRHRPGSQGAPGVPRLSRAIELKEFSMARRQQNPLPRPQAHRRLVQPQTQLAAVQDNELIILLGARPECSARCILHLTEEHGRTFLAEIHPG